MKYNLARSVLRNAGKAQVIKRTSPMGSPVCSFPTFREYKEELVNISTPEECPPKTIPDFDTTSRGHLGLSAVSWWAILSVDCYVRQATVVVVNNTRLKVATKTKLNHRQGCDEYCPGVMKVMNGDS